MINLAEERAALVALLHPPRKFKWASIRTTLLEDDLRPSDLVMEKHKEGEIYDLDAELDLASHRIDGWEADGTRFLTYLDDDYPLQLKEVHDFPPFIFVRGDLRQGIRERGVCIVGSRNASPEAIRDAGIISRGFVQYGITVISGLAAGIDSAAHRAALEAGGRTVGIIGTGIDRYYPKISAPLQERMERGEGMVLSQFWPGSAPTKMSFPMRNGVMSAFSRATLIVEASEKSGTRHQAFRAIRHGRPLILSEGVAKHTSWGRELADENGKFDVHVARSVDEAMDLAIACSRPLTAVKSFRRMSESEW